MEATSIYSFYPAYFFANDVDLKKLNLEIDVVNPRSTQRFHAAFEENKNDPIDAYYIAEYLRYGKYRVTIARQEEYLALQRLTRTRYEISHSLSWRQNKSGDFNSEHTPRLKTGNSYLRYYLVEAANLIRLRDPVCAKYYRKKYDEATFSPHKRACILCARKLSRTIFTLLKNGQIYQTPR